MAVSTAVDGDLVLICVGAPFCDAAKFLPRVQIIHSAILAVYPRQPKGVRGLAPGGHRAWRDMFKIDAAAWRDIFKIAAAARRDIFKIVAAASGLLKLHVFGVADLTETIADLTETIDAPSFLDILTPLDALGSLATIAVVTRASRRLSFPAAQALGRGSD